MGGRFNEFMKGMKVRKQYVGKFDEHGNQVTASNAASYDGQQLFNTQNEALDRRFSYSDTQKAGIFGQKRKNLFGN